MAYIPRSSFGQAPSIIPMQVKKKHTIRIVNLLGTIMLSGVVISAVGVFVYKQYLNNQLQSVQSELNGLSGSDNERKMKEIEVYDQKLTIAHGLLNNHLSTSKVLAEIENITKQTVRFKTFEYIYDPGYEAEVTLGGDTKALTSVALQKMELLKGSTFSDFVVRGITTEPIANPNADDSKEVSKKEEDKGAEKSLGVGFEVVGIFLKDKVAYTGATPIRQNFTSLDTASATNNGTDIDKVTPSTATSNNQMP
ncbi:hypothetical protein IPH92_03190 [Candidatus Kaiserbacteria bacterium]|nr:MAG: hypothetical protein IPH92_03190 [Candidatus Kaiserbacteria bacterium]